MKGWTEVGVRLTRTHLGHALEVWREGAWRWSLDGTTARRPETSREKACKRALTAALAGEIPDQRYRAGHHRS